MSKKLFKLSVFTVALAAVFMFAAPGISMAKPNENLNYNLSYVGPTNSFGSGLVDNAMAVPSSRDRDVAPSPSVSSVPSVHFQTYGLQGDLTR